MFERFTEEARQIVVFAQEEARALGHRHIGTEHLLLALARDADAPPAQLLARHGVTLDAARERVVAIVGRAEERPPGQIPFTPRGKKTLELALRSALSRGSNHIVPEHIMLGLLREGDGVAHQVLAQLGALGPIQAELGVARGQIPTELTRVFCPPPPIRWLEATVMWRPEGVEIRVPIRLDHDEMAALATDVAWSSPPLAGLEREVWRGWLAIRSPTLLDDVDPRALRTAIDAVIERISTDVREGARIQEFLQALRDPPQ